VSRYTRAQMSACRRTATRAKERLGNRTPAGGRCSPSPRHILVCGLIDHAILIVKEATLVSHEETMHAACQTVPTRDYSLVSPIARPKTDRAFDSY